MWHYVTTQRFSHVNVMCRDTSLHKVLRYRRLHRLRFVISICKLEQDFLHFITSMHDQILHFSLSPAWQQCYSDCGFVRFFAKWAASYPVHSGIRCDTISDHRRAGSVEKDGRISGENSQGETWTENEIPGWFSHVKRASSGERHNLIFLPFCSFCCFWDAKEISEGEKTLPRDTWEWKLLVIALFVSQPHVRLAVWTGTNCLFSRVDYSYPRAALASVFRLQSPPFIH